MSDLVELRRAVVVWFGVEGTIADADRAAQQLARTLYNVGIENFHDGDMTGYHVTAYRARATATSDTLEEELPELKGAI